MRRCIALLLILLITGSVQAESDSISNPGLRVYVEETGGMEMSGLLGGIAIDVGTGNLSNSTGDVPSSSWPAIAEVYTATWCGNCLDSEHAIKELIGERPIETLHYHREYSEISDPFGTEVGDDRWIARYGVTNKIATDGLERLPPSAVFNGEWLHSGSVPKVAESLSGDYAMSLDTGSSLPNEGLNASLSWTPDDANSTNGIASWSISENLQDRIVEDIWLDDCIVPAGTSVTPVLFIVENIARYEDGSNGLEYYPHVIRDIVRVENAVDASSGSTTIQMPDVWDGEDLRLVLALEWSTIFVSQDEDCSSDLVESIDRSIPAIGALSSAAIIGIAALFPRFRKDV
ncbi:MAG: hypothetical protein DBX05_07010 [Candidatus Poseidoniales archaeon]|nr:MAG: hypothetical protein DBX05_07010 [Candidatus Poseidoniales archaeon]